MHRFNWKSWRTKEADRQTKSSSQQDVRQRKSRHVSSINAQMCEGCNLMSGNEKTRFHPFRNVFLKQKIQNLSLLFILLLRSFFFCDILVGWFLLIDTSMVESCEEPQAVVPLEQCLFDLHLPAWERPAGGEALRPGQELGSGFDLVPDHLQTLLLCVRSCTNAAALWDRARFSPRKFNYYYYFPSCTLSAAYDASLLCHSWISASVRPSSRRPTSSFSPSCRAWNWERLLTPAACAPNGRYSAAGAKHCLFATHL